jgi:hypothetical protein
MDVSMGAVALLGGTVVLVAVMTAIVVLGRCALDRARPEDVPAVAELVMRVFRDILCALRRGMHPNNRTVPLQRDQFSVEGGESP